VKLAGLSRRLTLLLAGLVVVAGLVVGLVMAVVLFWSGLPSFDYFQTERFLADLTGFLGAGLTISSGVIMPFKKQVLAWTRDRWGLRWMHYIVAGAGGFFIALHIALSLALFLTLQYLLGVAATGGVVFIWITGMILVEELRWSTFHSLLSLIGVVLIVFHTFTANVDIPDLSPDVAYSMLAVVAITGVVGEIVHFLRARAVRK